MSGGVGGPSFPEERSGVDCKILLPDDLDGVGGGTADGSSECTSVEYSCSARSLYRHDHHQPVPSITVNISAYHSFFCSSSFLLSPLSHSISSSRSSSTLRSSLIVARSPSLSLYNLCLSCFTPASSSWVAANCCSVKSSLADNRRCARDSSVSAVEAGGIEGGAG